MRSTYLRAEGARRCPSVGERNWRVVDGRGLRPARTAQHLRRYQTRRREPVPPGRARERHGGGDPAYRPLLRSEEHTSELQSLMRISYAVFCLKKKKYHIINNTSNKS